MSETLSERNIVRAVADAAAWRIARKVIGALQRMTHTLSGEGSELTTTWDEICVQVQTEESLYWDAYDATARALVDSYVDELPKHEREALWLQTDAGGDWEVEADDARDADPVIDDDIVDHVLRRYVYAEAGRWSNARIRAFIDRSSRRD
jgi:hypothetical protein